MDQPEITSWIWDQVWNGNQAQDLTSPMHTPKWSEFEVTAPDGTRATVHVELKS
jgi:hypothetical protein